MKPIEKIGFYAHARTQGYVHRIEKAKKIVVQALELPGLFIATSWGKDSLVMQHMVHEVNINIPMVHLSDINVELLGNYTAVKESYFKQYPEVDYCEIYVKHGYKGKVPTINQYVKQYKGRFIGLRMKEQGGRTWSLKKYGPIYQYKNDLTYRICPLIDLTWQDIWAYIVINNLKYLDVYDHPAVGPKSISRTASTFSKNLLGLDKRRGGATMGRLAMIRQYAPDYYDLLKCDFPEIENFT